MLDNPHANSNSNTEGACEIKDQSEIINPPATHESEILSLERPQRVFGLLSACGTELLRAESLERTLHSGNGRNLKGSATSTENVPPSINTQIYEPLLPPSVSDQMQQAMHGALVSVMVERDEAHAQLIASNVLHVHELEQERHKNAKLRIEQQWKEERARFQQPNVGNFFHNLHDDKARRDLQAKFDHFENILGRNSDEELAQTSRQLAEEISAKTSHSLEIVRLKEAREVERSNEAAEKEALKGELLRVKALLAEQEAQIAALKSAAASSDTSR